jgi:hypothetical protein
VANSLRHFTENDHIRDRESAARFRNTKGFAKDLVLVAGNIDDAIGDDHVNRVLGQWNIFDSSLPCSSRRTKVHKVTAVPMEELDTIRDYLNRMPEHQD